VSRKLQIGGTQHCPGWEILNVIPGPYVDHVCNARDLSRFADNTFAEIYASHVLEHFDYQSEIDSVLREWLRALAPGGKLYISVPDLDVLAWLFIQKDRFTPVDRFFVMRMIFGGHMDKSDYHFVGLNHEFLACYLHDAGYINIQRVDTFGFFSDTSCASFMGVPISLNMKAEKP
jgi:predicted SAM-dependent methyltransferase